MIEEYKAYLLVKEFGTDKIIHKVGINNLSDRHVERVMSGMLRQMNTDLYYIDDSEIDAARLD